MALEYGDAMGRWLAVLFLALAVHPTNAELPPLPAGTRLLVTLTEADGAVSNVKLRSRRCYTLRGLRFCAGRSRPCTPRGCTVLMYPRRWTVEVMGAATPIMLIDRNGVRCHLAFDPGQHGDVQVGTFACYDLDGGGIVNPDYEGTFVLTRLGRGPR